MDVLRVAARVGEALAAAGAAYFLGGSLASSLQGDPRATNDIDLVSDLRPEAVPAFVAALGPDFEVDAQALAEALRRRGSWNLFFLPQFVKVDLFAKGAGPFDESEFARRAPVEVLPGVAVVLKSAEDTVLRKLLWFRAGGGVSERQWRDVVEVLRVSGPTLEQAYLERWAGELGLVELLARARAEADAG